MNFDDDQFSTGVIAWVVIITITLGILLPYTVNVPTLPAFFYKTVTERSGGASIPPVTPGQYPGNAEGLLVHYDFEDPLFMKSHMVADISGNYGTAIPNGVFIGPAPGVIGNYAVSLPGTGYLYSEADPAAGRTNVSFSLWFTAPDQTHNYRLASAISDGSIRTGWIIGTRSSDLWDREGRPVRVVAQSRSAGSLPLAAWNHKVVVYNGSSVTEYFNGAIVSSYAASGEPLGAGRGMIIGSWEPFGQNYAGRIDDFRIYDRALTQDEVGLLWENKSLTGY